MVAAHPQRIRFGRLAAAFKFGSQSCAQRGHNRLSVFRLLVLQDVFGTHQIGNHRGTSLVPGHSARNDPSFR